jgi:hypothetical protein
MEWWMILLAVLAVGVYAYSISSTIKVAGKPGCSSCPKQDNQPNTV